MSIFSNKKFVKNKKANAAIEFALVIPVVLLLIFGILEFGLTLFADSTVNAAIKIVAREGMVKPHTSVEQVKAEVAKKMGPLWKDSATIVVCIRPDIILTSGTPDSTIASLSNNPGGLFNAPPAGCQTAGVLNISSQANAILIYGIQYPWGGVSKIMAGFIPRNLFSISMVRSEYVL